MSPNLKRVCVIGAGPSGMSALFHFDQMKRDNVPGVPEFVCYEKQADCGGLWNFSWRTGVDEFGELCHHGMYHHLWSNGPKEALEFPDYTFEEHFGKAIPSYPPREVMRDYLEGRWTKDGRNLRQYIEFSTIVKSVQYNTATDDFTVYAKNLVKDRDEKPERFSHVIIAVGIFSTPNIPQIEGIDTFPGRVLHSHDFRDAEEFKGKRLLIVGAKYSAEDIALQCKKYGSDHIICSYRGDPMGFKWPEGIEERPLAKKIKNRTVFFKDGSTAEVDGIIVATGYKFHYPFLSDELRLKCSLAMCSPDLYKQTVWLKGGNNKLMYLGAYDQYLSFTIFDLQALWACKYIMGGLPENNVAKEEMEADSKKWRTRALKAKRDAVAEIRLQIDVMADLVEHTGYPKEVLKGNEPFETWRLHKIEDVCTYRDRSIRSIFTGAPSPVHHTPFMVAFDNSLDTFVNQTANKQSLTDRVLEAPRNGLY